MKELLLVGAGGCLGSVLRYLVSRWMLPLVTLTGFPWATLSVNVLGSLLIGSLFGATVSGGWSLLAVTGFCGGFTTFSTFSLEAMNLLRAGNYLMATVYMLSSVLLSLLAVWCGMRLGAR